MIHGEHAGGGHGELEVGERRQAGDHCIDNGAGMTKLCQVVPAAETKAGSGTRCWR